MSPPSYSHMGREPEEASSFDYEFQVQASDRCLPLANVARIMKTALLSNANVSREAKETMQKCVGEVISFITGEAVKIRNSRDRRATRGEEVLLAFHNLSFENYAEALTIYLARFRGVARDELAASLEGLQWPKKEPVESSHSGTKEELGGTFSEADVANRVGPDSEDDAHVIETKMVDECRSVVDELLAQWTAL